MPHDDPRRAGRAGAGHRGPSPVGAPVARARIPAGVRRAAVGAAALRLGLPIAGLALAPALLPEDVLTVVLLRPGKEFLLLAGGLHRMTGDPALGWLLAAYLPLMVLGVWAFFLVGRAYAGVLAAGDGPGWLHRLIRPEHLRIAQGVLAEHGPAIAAVGRLAALPPTVVAAAAGTSDVPAHRFLAADGAGALAAFGIVVGVGIALGRAYEQAGVWLTAAGLAVFAVLVAVITRWLRREAARIDRRRGAPARPGTDAA